MKNIIGKDTTNSNQYRNVCVDGVVVVYPLQPASSANPGRPRPEIEVPVSSRLTSIP